MTYVTKERKRIEEKRKRQLNLDYEIESIKKEIKEIKNTISNELSSIKALEEELGEKIIERKRFARRIWCGDLDLSIKKNDNIKR